MKNKINLSEIEFVELSKADNVGTIVKWRDRIFRAIRHKYVEEIKRIFKCGLIDELISDGLFPESWITDFIIDEFGLIVEHKKIPIVTYPYEWTFSMLKDAASTTLKINIISKKYGYQTKDGHGYNILFDVFQPKFIDLGSFVERKRGYNSWDGYEEFLRFYYYPLRIWSSGNEFIARRILNTQYEIPHHEYYLYKYSLLRNMFAPCLIKRIMNEYFRFRRLSQFSPEKIKNKMPKYLGAAICFLRDRNLMPLQSIDMVALVTEIENMAKKRNKTEWCTYHNEHYSEVGKVISTRRFDRIIDIIKSFDITSVVELAGNQGVFSRLLQERTEIRDIICSDYDEGAVDSMYLMLKDKNVRITPVLLDFISPDMCSGCELPNERLKSDAVVALAATHHLLLSQGVQIDYMLKTIASYTKKYAFVEFMPLGLYSGKNVPSIPSWYRVDWFRNSFNKYFSIIVAEKLEENRILFVGRLM